jgi:hypothetical protein
VDLKDPRYLVVQPGQLVPEDQVLPEILRARGALWSDIADGHYEVDILTILRIPTVIDWCDRERIRTRR